MTCFSIVVCLPSDFTRRSQQAMNEKRMRILLRTRNPEYFHTSREDGLEYKVALCDRDAVQFLNDLPPPFYVKQITYQYGGRALLFSNRWLESAQNPDVPPRSFIEKDVYWAAKATERWTPRKIEK